MTPFRVSGCKFDKSQSTVSLSAKPIRWKGAYDIKVDFKPDQRDYRVNRHDHLRRRNLASDIFGGASGTTLAPTLSTPAVSSLSVIPTSSQVIFPSPTASATATSIVQNVGKSLQGVQILPPFAAPGVSIDGISVDPGLIVSCANCTTTGKVTLTEGSFTITSSNSSGLDEIGDFMSSGISKDIDEIENFIQSGFLQVTADDLSAHIELDAKWPQTQNLVGKTYTITLATIPLQPFSIPDVAVIGPMFQPRLQLSAGVSADIDFKYGFEMTVPNNSTALANIGQVNQSSLTGFDQTKFTALPFTSSVSSLSLNLSATLQPELLLGISLLNSIGTAGAGIFLNLPQLSVSVSPVSGTNDRCEPITDNAIIQDIASHFGKLIHVVPAGELAGGFVAQAKVGIPGLKKLEEQTAWTPLATSFAPPTACLAFDKGKSGLVTATAAEVAAAASSSSSGVEGCGWGVGDCVRGVCYALMRIGFGSWVRFMIFSGAYWGKVCILWRWDTHFVFVYSSVMVSVDWHLA